MREARDVGTKRMPMNFAVLGYRIFRHIMRIEANHPDIVAPCGINCSLCRAYLRERKPCPGCRGGAENKSDACLSCAISNCEELARGGLQFCSSCDSFPCANLKHLEARYTTKYGVSVIANLQRIKEVGVERFVAEESARWTCPGCGARLCMHKPRCASCGYAWRQGA